jgi:hypothetical protein
MEHLQAKSNNSYPFSYCYLSFFAGNLYKNPSNLIGRLDLFVEDMFFSPLREAHDVDHRLPCAWAAAGGLGEQPRNGLPSDDLRAGHGKTP